MKSFQLLILILLTFYLSGCNNEEPQITDAVPEVDIHNLNLNQTKELLLGTWVWSSGSSESGASVAPQSSFTWQFNKTGEVVFASKMDCQSSESKNMQDFSVNSKFKLQDLKTLKISAYQGSQNNDALSEEQENCGIEGSGEDQYFDFQLVGKNKFKVSLSGQVLEFTRI